MVTIKDVEVVQKNPFMFCMLLNYWSKNRIFLICQKYPHPFTNYKLSDSRLIALFDDYNLSDIHKERGMVASNETKDARLVLFGTF